MHKNMRPKKIMFRLVYTQIKSSKSPRRANYASIYVDNSTALYLL